MKRIKKLILVGVLILVLSHSVKSFAVKYNCYDENGEEISTQEYQPTNSDPIEDLKSFFKFPFKTFDFEKFLILMGSVSIFLSYSYGKVLEEYGEEESDFLSNWVQYLYSTCIGVINWISICNVYYKMFDGEHFLISVGISTLCMFLAGTKTGNLILGAILLAGSSTFDNDKKD